MPSDECQQFLKIAEAFKLGSLETEKPHPQTVHLSEQAQTNLPAAIDSLKQVDQEALKKLKQYIPDLSKLGGDIHHTLKEGGRIYLCGCGATGRLSISLEVFCRQGLIAKEYRKQFIGFMAGGDAALIKSIENFEDHPEFGARQLIDLGFSQNDLLISTTEGGETPFVIGATEEAAKRSLRKPWFLYCNPEIQLVSEVERSARVIQNPDIHSCSLFVGAMGLSGSTRMQASTVLMAAVGWAIEHGNNEFLIRQRLSQLRKTWQSLNLQPLKPFISKEATCYQKSEYVIYQTDAFGVTVLTDTTERAPTFSLAPFENVDHPEDPPGWCYLSIPSAESTPAAWTTILKREPRCLIWPDIEANANLDYLLGFYIDKNCSLERITKTRGARHHPFSITSISDGFQLSFKESIWDIQEPGLTFFEYNLLLKLILNIQSTLIMGVMGRFESNLMTYVKPSNFKLIDRSIRYVQRLAQLSGLHIPEYDKVAEKLFSLKQKLSPEEPIVLRVLESLISRMNK